MPKDEALSVKANLRPGTLGALVLGATAYFVLVIVAMHALSPAIDPVQRPTSEYATGPFGYLMTSAFLALSLATWSLVIGLNRSLRPQGAQRIGLYLLGWFGAALLIAAAFPIDPEGQTTFHGTVHRINGPVAFLSLTLGTNFTSRLFRNHVAWQPAYRTATVLALLMIPEFIAGGITATRGVGAGIAQRVMIATFVAWFLIVGFRMRSRSG